MPHTSSNTQSIEPMQIQFIDSSKMMTINIQLTRPQQCHQLALNMDRSSCTGKAIDVTQKVRAGRAEHKVARPPRNHSKSITRKK